MKKLVKNLAQVLNITFIYVLLFIIPTVVLPTSDALNSRLNNEEMQLFFPLLLVYSLYVGVTYWYFRKNLSGNRIQLLLFIAIAHMILFPLMGLLESLYWHEAFSYISKNEFLRIALRFTLTYVLFSAFIVYSSKSISNKKINVPINKEVILTIGIIALIYYVIYNVFGYYVAWQFEETRLFYTGSTEIESFASSFIKNSTDVAFVGMHLFRGILFGFAGYLLYQLIDTKPIHKILLLSLIFGGFGFQILLPNPVFPEMVRISHFLETTSSMWVFGLLIAIIFSLKDNNAKV